MSNADFKKKLINNDFLKGCWLALSSSIAAEAISYVGLDFVVLDMEHAPNDISTAVVQLQAINNGTSAHIVRVPENNPIWIKKALDIGSRHLLVPMVNSVSCAKAAVRSARYPTQGIRGVGSQHRACHYGLDKDYFLKANQETTVIVQIETKEAVDSLEPIAMVDGIDALFVGPADLAASLGYLGGVKDVFVQKVICDIADRCHSLGKPVGILASDVETANNYVAMGYTFVAVGSDISFMLAGAKHVLTSVNKRA